MNFWYWAALIGGLYALFKQTAPVKKLEAPKEEPRRRADLPPSASPEMKGDEFPDVSDSFGKGKYAIVRHNRKEPEGETPDPFRDEPKEGGGVEGNGQASEEGGTLSEDEMDNLSQFDDGMGESEGG
jgi:hypothetical protein